MKWPSVARFASRLGIVAGTMAFVSGPARAQQPAPSLEASSARSPGESVRGVQTQVRELRALLLQMRAAIDGAHAANLEITERLRETQERLEVMHRDFRTSIRPDNVAGARSASQTAPPEEKTAEGVEERLAKVEEDQQLLTGKIDEQYKTKVTSAS